MVGHKTFTINSLQRHERRLGPPDIDKSVFSSYVVCIQSLMIRRLKNRQQKQRKKIMDNRILSSIILAIQSYAKGCERTIVQERPAKVKKAYQSVNLIKQSTIPCRFVNYMAQKSAIEARENGRTEQANNWESYQAYCDGLFKDHNGKLKVCIGHSALGRKGKKQFYLDGQPVELEQVKHMLLSSETATKPMPDWYTLDAENIVQIDDFHIKPSVSKA